MPFNAGDARKYENKIKVKIHMPFISLPVYRCWISRRSDQASQLYTTWMMAKKSLRKENEIPLRTNIMDGMKFLDGKITFEI